MVQERLHQTVELILGPFLRITEPLPVLNPLYHLEVELDLGFGSARPGKNP